MQEAGLINIKSATGSINTPAAGQAFIYQKAEDGLFYVKLPDGSSVLLGGSTPGASAIPSVAIATADGLTYTTVVTGGTAPYTYAWENAYKPVGNNSTPAETFDGAVDEDEATLNDTDPSRALVKVVVTDANGIVCSDTYLYENLTT